tara:strand:+ start:3298 stop:3924 length:627 start_codon:yes stop_codon:yes gene_type:complete
MTKVTVSLERGGLDGRQVTITPERRSSIVVTKPSDTSISVTTADSLVKKITQSLVNNTVNVSVPSSTSMTVTKPSDITVEVLEKGSKGEKGDKGDAGIGFPAGGTTGQYMIKASNADYDATWTSVSGSGLFNVVEDTTPQLGGNLDVQSRSLFTSTTDGNITITPNGTGYINLDGTIKFRRFSTPPTAFEGGMYADDQDNLFFGISDS